MNSLSLGDLAQTFMLQRRGAQLRNEFSRITQEVASGRVSDVKSVLRGNTQHLTEIENDLVSLTGYRVATIEAAQFTDTSQTALGLIQSRVESLSTALVASAPNALGSVLDQITNDAQAEMATIISALNTTSGGRSVFAGRATDQAALEGVDTILSALRAATATVNTPDELKTQVEDWFNDPAGFATVAYNGTDDMLVPFRLAGDETVSMGVTANDIVFRNILAQISVAVLSNDANFRFGIEDRQQILQNTGQKLLETQTDLTAVRSSIGSAQARIDEIATRNATEQNALLFAKNALLQVDPFEAATELEAVQFQLQSLYTVTARMSDLSFVNFVR